MTCASRCRTRGCECATLALIIILLLFLQKPKFSIRYIPAWARYSPNKKDRAALRVVRKISDAISNSIDVGLGSYVQYAYHVYDIWGASELKGVMDVAQTADWENCKLPVMDTGLQSLGMYACGDETHAIPLSEKQKNWEQHAFWCSGFLMLKEGDGSDLLVWNPYSLGEMRGESGCADGARVGARRRGNGTSDNKTLTEYSPRPACDGGGHRATAGTPTQNAACACGVGSSGRVDATGCACGTGPAAAGAAAGLERMS